MKKEEIVAELQAKHPYLTGGGLRQAIFLINLLCLARRL